MVSLRGPVRVTKISRHDVQKLKVNRITKSSKLSKEEWAALTNIKKRNDVVMKAADKGGALTIWQADLYRQKQFDNFLRPQFGQPKNNKDLHVFLLATALLHEYLLKC